MPSPARGETARGETLDRLRRSFAKIDPNSAGGDFLDHAGASLRLGVPGLDAALQGGLAYGALHELAPAAPGQLGAALGFALTLAALTAADSRAVLVIQTDFASLEAGAPYGPGLELLGLPLQRLVLLRLPRPLDLLAAFEEALRSRAVALVLAELAEAGAAAAADLTATRRLSLAARAGGGLGLLLRYQASALPTAATTRWEVAAALSTPDRLGGLGRTAFALSLTRNRRGRCGRFNLCWDHHERIFIAPTLSLAETTDRLTRARAPALADRPAHVPAKWSPVRRHDHAPCQNSRACPDSNGTGHALVVAAEVKGALRLAAVNDAAARLGLTPSMALADARAMYPTIAVAAADPDADRRMLEGIADWCDRYTPLVGLAPPDGLVLDVTGCAHLFGGEAALGRDLVRRLGLQGFQARAAVADTVGCAFAVARFGEAERGREGGRQDACLIISSADTRAALLPLPLAALRVPAETVEALAQVGLKRIADVVERPRPPLAARFGEDFVRRLDQALGRDDEPIAPRLPVPAYVAEQRFADPILLESDVLATIAHLAQELARLLERRGEGARTLEVALFRADGKVQRIAAGTGAPLRDGARIRDLFAERLAAVGEDCDPGFGYDVIRLAARAAERCDPAQTGLAAGDHAAELAHLIDRLGARFGLRRVTRLVPQDTHIPEFAVAAVPAHEVREMCPGSAVHRAVVVERSSKLKAARCTASGTQSPSDQDSLAPVRPIHLFERPERIEAMAEVPDGPPVQFTWRRVRHQVAHAEGPERIAMPWWHDETGRALTRDYFRIESRDGVRVWVYREGLYGRETRSPRWFLHGLFA